MSTDKTQKIIILHDIFHCKGGGEKLMLMMGNILKADIASGYFSAGSYDPRKWGFTGKLISVSSETFTKGARQLKLKYDFLFRTKFLREYDVVIFSGDCLGAVRNCRKDAKKVYYCHTPPRYMYDLYDFYLQKTPLLLKPLFRLFCYILRKQYESDLSQMDLILTNSRNTQARIRKYLHRDSTILYPPVDLDQFTYIDTKDYYFSFSRLASAKRVDLVVEAFKRMPDRKLIVSYGENDPQKEAIFEQARGYENIQFITFDANDMYHGKLFREYVGECIATIYIPIDEDFGMIPIESMGAGKPVLGVAEGGLRETIIDQKTGVLIRANPSVTDVIAGIEFLSRDQCIAMKDDCIARAQDFSLKSFEKQVREKIL